MAWTFAHCDSFEIADIVAAPEFIKQVESEPRYVSLVISSNMDLVPELVGMEGQAAASEVSARLANGLCTSQIAQDQHNIFHPEPK